MNANYDSTTNHEQLTQISQETVECDIQTRPIATGRHKTFRQAISWKQMPKRNLGSELDASASKNSAENSSRDRNEDLSATK